MTLASTPPSTVTQQSHSSESYMVNSSKALAQRIDNGVDNTRAQRPALRDFGTQSVSAPVVSASGQVFKTYVLIERALVAGIPSCTLFSLPGGGFSMLVWPWPPASWS
jgi:hypothetical protein